MDRWFTIRWYLVRAFAWLLRVDRLCVVEKSTALACYKRSRGTCQCSICDGERESWRKLVDDGEAEAIYNSSGMLVGIKFKDDGLRMTIT